MENCNMLMISESKSDDDASQVLPPKADKAASVPLYPAPEQSQLDLDVPQLKTQISAPSYLLSLKENEAPPFKRPGKEPSPMILIGTIMNEQEAIEMVAAAEADKEDGLNKWLSDFLVQKKIIENYSLSEKRFLISLVREVIDYAAQRDFTASKLSAMITIYLASHLYFKWYYWLSPLAVWYYFKELMIRHTVEDSPCGQETFEPDECADILSHYHTLVLSNLPLVHVLTHGACRLKLRWPFNTK